MNSIPQNFYVYILINSLTNKVFYVGKGCDNDRLNFHEREARKGVKSYKCNTIRKIWREGGKVLKKKVTYFAKEQDAFIYEWCLITLIYGRDNLTNITDGGEGKSGIAPSLETRMKMSQTRMQHMTQEKREEFGHFSKQMWSDPAFRERQMQFLNSPDFVQKRLEGARKTKNNRTYEGFIGPDGTIYGPIHNLHAFCKEHGLNRASMYDLDSGKAFEIRGWKRYPPLDRVRSTPYPRQYKGEPLLGPDGTVYSDIQDFTAFCKEHGLRSWEMMDVIEGKRVQHLGWTCYPPKYPVPIARIYHFVSPDGMIYKDVEKLRPFCRAHLLDRRALVRVYDGLIPSHRGWIRYNP